MPTMESLVRMINRRLTEVYDFFGYTSPEYQKLKSIVYSNWTDYSGNSYIVVQKGKPVKISAKKAHIEQYKTNPYLAEDAEAIWSTIKELGTVRQMAAKYVESLPKGKPPTKREIEKRKEEIRERARVAYASLYNDTDIYSEIMNEDPLDDIEYREDLADIALKFREKPGRNNPAGMDRKWDEIQDMYQKAQEKHINRLIGNYDEATEEPKFNVESTPNQYDEVISYGRDPFDMGVN